MKINLLSFSKESYFQNLIKSQREGEAHNPLHFDKIQILSRMYKTDKKKKERRKKRKTNRP